MSCSRRCDIFKATDSKWYMTLGDFEYAYDDHECSNYGPFASEEATIASLRNHSNPGSYCTDDSGKSPPPKIERRTNRYGRW